METKAGVQDANEIPGDVKSPFLKMADVDLAGKRVLIRQDLNVPFLDGEVSSTGRLKASVPTLRHALDAGARTDEIARMLSGETITEEARAAAEALMAG